MYLILDGTKWGVSAVDADPLIARVSRAMRDNDVIVESLTWPDDPSIRVNITINGKAVGTATVVELDE